MLINYYLLHANSCYICADFRQPVPYYLGMYQWTKRPQATVVCSTIRILHRSMGKGPPQGTDLKQPRPLGYFQHGGKEKHSAVPGGYRYPARYLKCHKYQCLHSWRSLHYQPFFYCQTLLTSEMKQILRLLAWLQEKLPCVGTSTRTWNVRVATQCHTYYADLTDNSGHEGCLMSRLRNRRTGGDYDLQTNKAMQYRSKNPVTTLP